MEVGIIAIITIITNGIKIINLIIIKRVFLMIIIKRRNMITRINLDGTIMTRKRKKVISTGVVTIIMKMKRNLKVISIGVKTIIKIIIVMPGEIILIIMKIIILILGEQKIIILTIMKDGQIIIMIIIIIVLILGQILMLIITLILMINGKNRRKRKIIIKVLHLVGEIMLLI